MRQKTFNELSPDQKLLLIEDIGTPVFSMEYYDHRINLYALNNMFVEVYHNIETKMVDRMESIAYNELDKYLSRILIDNLVKPGRKDSATSIL
jgi:hypothetical protein